MYTFHVKRFTSDTQKIGLLGEDIACRYLANKGLSIRERNYTRRWGEIDIIAVDKGNKIHFIEVKSSFIYRDSVSRERYHSFSHETGIKPEDNMHPKKMERFMRTVETYLSERGYEGEWSMDLVTVRIEKTSRRAYVQFLEDVIS